jgi:signal transduction histidine kinase/DNA-binding response OmpR family regulator/streptogramin lyase
LRLTATIALLNLLAFASSGQKTFISKRITVNDGLPQGFVSGIVQDDDGFIWLGTRDGLARYDGHEFKVFYSNDTRSTNISSNIITSLHHDHKNRIWILHESKAIDIFYPREERFESFTSDSAYPQVFKQFSPNFIRLDSQDQVWLIDPGNGLWKINLNRHRVDHLSRRDTGLLCDTIRGVIETANKHCWIFMQKGIQQIDNRNKVIKTIPFDFPAARDININRNFAAGLAIADERSILVRELNKAFVFDTQQLSVKEIEVDQDRPDDIATVPQRDASGNLYFELMRSLYKYDASTKSATKIWDGELEQGQSFLIDRSDVAWFGNSASGVQVLNLRSLPFKSYTYTSGFFVDLLRQLSIAPDNTRWAQYTRLSQYTRDVQTRYGYDNSGNVWLTFGNNAAIVNAKTKTFTELKPLQGKDQAFYFAPMTVANDTCWRVYSLTGTPVYYDNRNARWVYPLGDEWKLPAPTNILNIIKIGKTLWATTKHDGLLSINLSTGETHWHKQVRNPPGSWPTDELTDLERDPTRASLLWIGTRAGLVRFNMNTTEVQTFSVKSGLPNNTIYCIAADAKGFLWLSTNKGLCRFDPIYFKVRNFSGNDGLQGDEFNSFHEFVFPDGRIAFGGTGGITVFDPQLIKDDAFQPAVQITKVKINNEEANVTDSNFKGLLNEPAVLNLAYDQNFFTFYFAGLQFNNVEKIQHRYRLTGLDRDWNYAGHLGMANYTKVPPGGYILELNTSNTTGVWSSNIKRVFITIDPPLWMTPWAYVLYAILFVSGGVGYVRYTISRIRLKNLVELKNKEAVQLRKLDEVKSRFFTNITHEFRTPLTLIVSPLEQLLKQDDLQQSHKKQLTLIQQNSHQLLGLVNQFLDLSKLEAGITRPALTPGAPGRFIESLAMLFQLTAANRKLQLTFQNEIEDCEYLIDQDKIERILNNLLSNAIKFTPEGGSIALSLTKVKRDNFSDIVTLRVADTGIGIAADVLPRIFDRFYQAEGKAIASHEGTGIGLALVKELTNLLNGKVTVESRVGEGTIFTVALPLTKMNRETQLVTKVSASHNHYNNNEANSADDARPMILVAEDNDSLRGFLAEQLMPAYEVITASNGREAWEKIMNMVPSLVITDVMMPFLDGISLSRKIRETEETSHIGLIMLTARTSAESRLEGLQTGANDYIDKPFHFDELRLRIGNLLAHQKKQRDYFYRQLVREDNIAPKDVENEFLKKAYAFLDDALVNKKSIGVEDLASHFSMSSRTMNRKLQALVGLTVNEFIRNYRLARATTLLRKDFTVSEVAYEVGFESPQYFAQCFKAQYNMTPTEYAQKNQPFIQK